MEFTHEEMLQLLTELQVEGDTERLIAEERYPELYRLLRTCRCGFLDEVHKSQKKLDQLDYLIYQIKKKNKGGIET